MGEPQRKHETEIHENEWLSVHTQFSKKNQAMKDRLIISLILQLIRVTQTWTIDPFL